MRAQVAEGTARISAVDTAAFPEVDVYLAVNDATGNRVASLAPAAFTLTENSAPVAALSVQEAEVGVQVVFVLDTSAAFKTRDANGATRLDYLKQALTDFAQTRPWMKDGVDDVTVLAPEGTLLAHSSAGGKIVAALSGYATQYGGVADPFPLLNQALDFASDAAARPGMQRYVVFISNGFNPSGAEAALADLAARANAAHLALATVFVGPAGAENTVGAANLRKLAELTGAAQLVFAQPDSLTPLFQRLADQRTQYRLSYRSTLAVTGQHSVAAQVKLPGGAALASNESVFPLRVEPPVVSLSEVPESIRRIAQQPGADPRAVEPTAYEVAINVDYPDGHPRPLRAAELWVDGQTALTQAAASVKTLTWPLKDYAESGSHTLQARVTDELGLSAESEVVTVTVSVEIPPAATATFAQPRGLVIALLGSLLVVGAGAGGWLWFVRRQVKRGAPPASEDARLDETRPYTPQAKPRVTPSVALPQLHLPKRATPPKQTGKAYLKVVEPGGGGAPREDVEILGQILRLGRDASVAEVVFHDRSVSRLHARIAEAPEGMFRIFDEGSTSGTWVNFAQIPAEGGCELRSGDVINLGRVQLRFKVRAAASEERPNAGRGA